MQPENPTLTSVIESISVSKNVEPPDGCVCMMEISTGFDGWLDGCHVAPLSKDISVKISKNELITSDPPPRGGGGTPPVGFISLRFRRRLLVPPKVMTGSTPTGV
jgi:hypothetical protein